MAVLTLRSVKGSPLTNNELDNNFANLNSDITVINTGLSATNSNVGVLSNLTTASNSNVVTAINTLVSNIGVLSNLTTASNSNVVTAINTLVSNIGVLSNLITADKSNIVSAINSVATSGSANVGVVFNLTTPVTSNLVSAINSVNSRINTEVGSIGSLNTFVTSNVVSAINSLSSEYRSNVGVISNLLTTTKANVVNAVNEIVNRLTVIGITTSTIAGVEIFNSTWSANTIAISRGGTGQTTALGAFNAFSPLTTLGDVLYHNGTNNVRLPGSTTAAKRFLTQTGTGSVSAIPTWSTVDNGDIPASLTGKTYNSLTLTASAVGFTVAGGTTSKTLTINNTVALSGTDGSTLNISTGGTLGTAAFTSSSSYALTGGSNATGTWPISISGTAATATTASSVLWTNVSGRPTALSSFTNDTNYITSSGRAFPRRSDGGDLNFFWSGQGGQPTWLWGGNDGVNMYVYNPSNFSVSYAASSGTASSASSAGAVPASGITGQAGMWTSSARPGPYRLYRRDADDAYSVQTYWTGARWRLRGYLSNDAFHAEAEVGYADSSGYASSAGSAGSVEWTSVNNRPTSLSSFSNGPGYITSSGRAYPRRSDGGDLNFFWSGQGGQPPWLWGGSDGANMYVYNPSNFSVNYATTAGALSAGNNYQVNSLGVGTGPTGTSGEIRATNNITAYYSDVRLKDVLGYIDNALEKITSLTGFYYQANETAQALGYKPVRDIGLSAQDVQKVLPEAIAPAPIDDKYLTVRYEKLIPMIVEAIKEMSERIKSLEAK